MLEVELQTIESWARELPENSNVVEVGSFYGRSACCWALTVPAGSTVYCFDRWFGEEEELGSVPLQERIELGYPIPGTHNTLDNFLNNIDGLSNIVHKRINGIEDIQWSGPAPDLVFIDAAHENPADRAYIDYWLPLIKPGGYLCGHDYNLLAFPDVTDNANYVAQRTGSRVETFEHGSLWRVKV